MFFKDNPNVDFRLARIVQATPEAEQLLKEIGCGTGEVSWEEQFQHKFIISMDGNAGACSRVTNVLKSNSVLLRYDSQHLLHYSSHFVPWLHYVPIQSDADVNMVLDLERIHPGFFEYISIAGNKFFWDFLNKERIFDYAGALLRMYANSFARDGMQVAIDGVATGASMMRTGAVLLVSRADVIEAYRTVLGRDPESEETIRDHMAAASIQELYGGLLASEEFQGKFKANLKPLDWPPIEIEDKVTDVRQLAAMFERARAVWSALGEQDPYYAVCTDPKYLGVGGDDLAEDLYASGGHELRNLTSFAARAGIDLTGRACLELGCGVGRVTRWLAPLFRQVQGIDISPGHLAIAQQQLVESGLENVSLSQITSLDEMRQIFGYDVLFSVLVLQHNPPPLIAYMLMQLLSNLAPGGVAFFQVPTYGLDYTFGVDDYLNAPVPDEPQIEMHVLPQRDILKIVYAAGCRVLEMREDDYTGSPDCISNTFFVEKPT
jgi:2-polyprenyl-3-methyl-5-hydroxy-6-metoxy-1,4-benzoquinol methylase